MATRKRVPSAHGKSLAKPVAASRQRAGALPAGGGRDEVQPAAAATFPIVGIGASAGGLEAFEQFFRACPADTGMAFVLVPHLDPGHESLLTEILQRVTAMPVVQVSDQTRVEPDRVYIIPPNREMSIFNQVLQLSMPELARGQRMPIDTFLRSLAEDQAAKAIGVILSGTATDGTLGLGAILGVGGVCMVQEPSTARYDGMPQSAIAAGSATHILPVEKMPAMLQEVASKSAFRQKVPAIATDKTLSGMSQILLQVRKSTGHDFSLYKKSTIGRRIERRMAQHHIEDAAVYARYLKENPAEMDVLFKELLIKVTSFFRDPEAFVALKQTILPPLLAGKPEGYVFRVWVAGCATGEEAYSIAMVLLELMDERKARHEPELAVKIFATDLDDEAIGVARAGRYPPNIAQDVNPERLRRFFIKDEAGYKIKKDVRDRVVFAVQNVVKDPPFTKLDLLSCRNLMIYLEVELQNRLIPIFHYALKPDGVLFLSVSESIINHPELFTTLDRRWKFYRAKHAGAANYPDIVNQRVRASGAAERAVGATVVGKPTAGSEGNVGELSHRSLLQIYAPASVTTDARGNILFVHGDTGRYLRPAPGPASNNVIEMAREGLQLPLRAAILKASSEAAPTLDREASVKTEGGFTAVRVSVRALPWDRNGEPLMLVSFMDVVGPGKPAPSAKKGRGKGGAPTAAVKRIEELERELAYSKGNLQTTVEEQRATNEELKSTNEELQSTNEELQSSYEELETSKEELQSLNEEAITVNSELVAKVDQLHGMQNDVKNLLDSTNAGTLFLDHELIIRRYTPEAVKIYRLIATDVGRPLGDITSNIEGEELLTPLQGVLDTLIPQEREVRTSDGAWYLARMQPYRTIDNVIAGVVLTFTNVTDFKLASIKLEAEERALLLAEGIVNTVSEPLIVLDSALQVVSAGRSFYQHFHVKPEDTIGSKIYDLGNGQWNIPSLRQLLEDLLPQKQVLDGYVVEHDFPGLGLRRMVLNARRIVTTLGNTEMILLAMVAIEPVEKQ